MAQDTNQTGSIVNSIERDPKFAIGFALDNNPAGVIASLQSLGYTVGNSVDAYNIMCKLLADATPQSIEVLKKVYSMTPYIDNAPNYTANMRTYFMTKTPANLMPNTLGAKFDFTGLLAGLGAGLSVFSAIALGQNATGAGTGTGPADPQAAAAAAAAQKAKMNKIYWALGITGGVIVLGIVAYFIFKPKAKEAAKS